MLRQALAVALGVALLAGMSVHADAAKKKTTNIVTLRGCTHFRPPICTIINSGGHSYDLIGAAVPLNSYVTVRGEMSPMIGFCTVPVVRVLSVTGSGKRCPM